MLTNRRLTRFQIISILTLAGMIFLSLASLCFADLPPSRYFHSGDGNIYLVSPKNGASFQGRYRTDDGRYIPEALQGIHRVFNARYGDPISEISPRLIEFLDFLVDTLHPEAKITIASGWRSPTYNRKLREKGKLAAKASLHQYGMAADIKIDGVHSEHIWNYVKGLGFGGAGYYHGELVHVDVGPPRSWDETSSGVGTGMSDDNKLIGLITDRDIYLPGEIITLRFIRMTAFPIGVSAEFILEHMEGEGEGRKITTFTPSIKKKANRACHQFHDIAQMMGVTWKLPTHLAAGRYRIRSFFCENQWENMPEDVITPEFEIRQP